MNLNEVHKFLLEIVPKCGDIIRSAYYQEKSFQEKSCFADIVTETDEKIEKLLIGLIKQRYATHKFIGEESTDKKIELTDEPVWIIDPVDGTTNFYHKFPYCSLSVGLFVNKQPQIGVVFNPITDELFSAVRGQGAFLNGKTLTPSKQTELNKSQVITEFGSSRDEAKLSIVLENMKNLIPKVHSIRALGSAALNMCMIANGSAEVYYEFGIHCWDMAAGLLIAREAGCVVLDPSGGELDIMKRRLICAANMDIANKIIPLLKPIEYESD